MQQTTQGSAHYFPSVAAQYDILIHSIPCTWHICSPLCAIANSPCKGELEFAVLFQREQKIVQNTDKCLLAALGKTKARVTENILYVLKPMGLTPTPEAKPAAEE